MSNGNVRMNQIIAVANGRKGSSQRDLSRLYQNLQKRDLMTGVARTYRPLNEDGLQLPPENRVVQSNAESVLRAIEEVSVGLIDSVATMDIGNTQARSDVILDGRTILRDVPATHLIYLEKRLQELETVFGTIPTLDLDKNWTDNGDGTYSAEPTQSQRTEKTDKPVVLYDATEHHPAQTQMVSRDEVVGFWTNVAQSGAMTVANREELIRRTRRLREAVQSAREEANNTEVEQQKVGTTIFNELFNDIVGDN